MLHLVTIILLFPLAALAAHWHVCFEGIERTSLYVNNTEYYPDLYFNLQNQRFASNTTAKPAFILFPSSETEFKRAVKCANAVKLSVKIRSGGHSYEGLSSTSDVPFVIIDLKNWDKVTVNVEQKYAVVQTGATLGDIYYYISVASNGTYGFSAGSCPTVGSGGHISGGGFGLLSRKYGLAADNVIDVTFLDYAGNVYTRANASDDLYWALRGGGGGSFGIVLSWTIRILPVPAQVVVFNKPITGFAQALEHVYDWQTVGPYLDDNFYMSVFISGVNSTTVQHRRPLELETVAQDIQAIFHGQSLVGVAETLATINTAFPSLQLNASDLLTMTWIESIVYFSGLPANSSIEALLGRDNPNKGMFKAKSDYVQSPISREGITVAFEALQDNPNGYILFDPYGAKMWEIPADEIPFPHRIGNLYSIQYQVVWTEPLADAENIAWLRDFYADLAPYVSQNPRAAYVNYLDLDIGTINNGTGTFAQSSVYGNSYFIGNYPRLVGAKIQVDPLNYFRNSQSVSGFV